MGVSTAVNDSIELHAEELKHQHIKYQHDFSQELR
jgi:hypothetical protein